MPTLKAPARSTALRMSGGKEQDGRIRKFTINKKVRLGCDARIGGWGVVVCVLDFLVL